MGEALWDCLPEGKKIGGAPANFAYHASQFGFDSRVVSAVGADADGLRALDEGAGDVLEKTVSLLLAEEIVDEVEALDIKTDKDKFGIGVVVDHAAGLGKEFGAVIKAGELVVFSDKLQLLEQVELAAVDDAADAEFDRHLIEGLADEIPRAKLKTALLAVPILI